jgi:hypothetical protein
MTVVAANVTPRGVLVPRALIATWGDLQEVEIEKYADTMFTFLHASLNPRDLDSGSHRICGAGQDKR